MKVRDKQTGKFEQVINKTDNSFYVTQTKLTKDGINLIVVILISDLRL